MVMETTTRVKFLSIDVIFETDMVFSCVLTSKSEQTLSTMDSGNRISERVRATAITIMRTYMLANGRQIKDTGSVNYLHESKTGTRVNGRMTCVMEEVH